MNKFDFPKGFYWGASTAAHQVEGNNVNSDLWVLNTCRTRSLPSRRATPATTITAMRSDIALPGEAWLQRLPLLGSNGRASSRRRANSRAGIEHYRRMLAACHEHGITPIATYHHFTSPQWLMRRGGWLDEKTPDRFARYCERGPGTWAT